MTDLDRQKLPQKKPTPDIGRFLILSVIGTANITGPAYYLNEKYASKQVKSKWNFNYLNRV